MLLSETTAETAAPAQPTNQRFGPSVPYRLAGLEPDMAAPADKFFGLARRPTLKSAGPLVIVEVLSPSSIYADRVVKRDEYLDLPTLEAYVVADPNAAKLILWERREDGAFPNAPAEICGLDAALTLRGLALSSPLRELYRAIDV